MLQISIRSYTIIHNGRTIGPLEWSGNSRMHSLAGSSSGSFVANVRQHFMVIHGSQIGQEPAEGDPNCITVVKLRAQAGFRSFPPPPAQGLKLLRPWLGQESPGVS